MSDRLLKVEGQPDYVKDMNTGAVLNVNRKRILAARQAKEKRNAEKQKQEEIHEKVDSLEKGFQEIKQMLQNLLHINKQN